MPFCFFIIHQNITAMRKRLLNRLAALALPLAMMPQASQSKDIYGFMTGNGDIANVPSGFYQFDTDGDARTILAPYAFQFWGGAYGADKYYMVLSDDNGGFLPEGLCCYDLADGTYKIPMASQTYQCSDMTYDYSTSTMYGVQTRNGGESVSHRLIKIDLSTGKSETVASFDRKIAAIACDYFGDMYAMDYVSRLYRVDKLNAKLTLVGATGVSTDNTEMQSMEFDRATGELYWSYLSDNYDACLAKVDPATGALLTSRMLADNALYVGLHIPFTVAAADAPAKPGALTVTSAGASVSLSWTNPVQTYGGGTLAGLTKIEIVRDGKVVHTIDNPGVGAPMTWTDNPGDDARGVVRYVVYAYNEAGRGEGAVQTVVLGDDVPGCVTGLTVKADGDGALLSWTAPAEGVNGGTLTPGNLRYRVTRMPGNVVFDDISGTSFADNTIAAAAYYTYSVVCYNAAGESDATASDRVMAGPAIEVPYVADFTSELCGAQWLVADGNGDGYTWRYDSSAGTYSYVCSFFSAADDHLVSVPFSLKAGEQYAVKYSVMAPSLFGSKEHFRLSVTAADGTVTVLDELDGFSCEEAEAHTAKFTVAETGDHTFTMSALSQADQFMITVSAFSVEAVTARDLALTSAGGELDLTVGDEAEISATVENRGNEPIDAYTLVLADSRGEELASLPVTTPLAAGAAATHTVRWTPAAPGETALTLTVVAEGDAVESNNAAALTANVIPADEKYVELGGRDSRPTMLPFAFDGSTYSYSQAIYRKADIGCRPGVITELRYPYTNNGDAIADRHIKVYVANTTRGSVLEGWTAESAMELVFDGNVTFDRGDGVMVISFSEPFDYTGDNICVMCQKLDDVTIADVRFYAFDSGEDVCTALYNSDQPALVLTAVQGSTMLNNVKMRVKEDRNPDGISPVAACGTLAMRLDGRRLVVTGGVAARVTVSDLAGKTVAEATRTTALDLSRLAGGVYIVSMVSADGQAITEKLSIK